MSPSSTAAVQFDHRTLGQRVRFGTNAAAENLCAEVRERRCQRVMVIDGARRGIADALTAGIEVAARHGDVAAHVPIDLARRASKLAVDTGADLLVSIGGGSTTGLAKAVALDTGIPIVAVPTTYSGSEATDVWGVTEDARKTTGKDNRVLPETVIYDAALTVGLPIALSVASGLNALAHCIDAMWAPQADPINQALATEGIRVLNNGLPQVFTDPSAQTGREQCLYGAYLSAVAFASAGSGMHHKICHVLGGAYGLPHAELHACVLPHVLAYNAAAAPIAERRIALAFGAPDADTGLAHLRETLDAPKALRDYGFREGNIAEAVTLVLPAIPASNPRRLSADDLAALLSDATTGADPTRHRRR